MENRRRADRFAVTMAPEFLRMINIRRGMWHESLEEIEAGLEWGRRKAQLLRWVRRKMGRRLTPRERECVELHFFQGMTYIEIAAATGISPGVAHRAVVRSLRKLRITAQRSRIPPAKRRPKEQDCD